MAYKGAKKREYARVWLAKRRQAFFEERACAACGSTTDLELDHLDPASKVSHRIWSWSSERRQSELAKCQALCQTCHKDKTRTDKLRAAAVFPHGTRSRYDSKAAPCRCDMCRKAHAEAVVQWKTQSGYRLKLRP